MQFTIIHAMLYQLLSWNCWMPRNNILRYCFLLFLVRCFR